MIIVTKKGSVKMSYFQILTCNDTLGTCCNDYGIVVILDIMRKFFDILQLVVPILLLIMSMVQLAKMMANPDDKKVTKQIFTKVIAAVMCFMLPVLVDTMLGLFSSNETFQVAACWEQAKISSEVTRLQNTTYIDKNDNRERHSILIDPSKYQTGTPPADSSSGGSGSATATGRNIVNYAKSFVGQRYVWGGTWNGERPYTGTDCSGFVQGVFRHHGINLTRTTYTQWADKSSYTLVNENNIRAGDLVMYDGHVGILTGNGNEIVHAKGSKWGIVVDSNYKTCSSHAILGIMRINGV